MTLMSDLLGYPTGLPEAEALFARMDVQPSQARKEQYNIAIQSLIDNDDWDNSSAIYSFTAHTLQAALLNWKGSTYDATAVASPTHTPDVGIILNGTTQYLNLNFDPSSDSLFDLSDASFGIWNSGIGLDDGESHGCIDSGDANNQTRLTMRTNAARVRCSLGSVYPQEFIFAQSQTETLLSVVKPDGTDIELWQDGVIVSTETESSTAQADEDFFIGAFNAGGLGISEFCDQTCKYAFLGNNSVDQLNMYDVFNDFNTAL